MQQNIQRMSGQVQAMQQEVRELTQIAQQLYQQHTSHYQQLQGQMMQNNQIYQLAGNEHASANLLQTLTDVCTEMNQHLRTISQQVSSNSASLGGSQMATGSTTGTMRTMGTMSSAGQPSSQNKGTANASMSAQPLPGNEADVQVQGNLSEYRDEPNETLYPYNRYTT